MYQDYLDDIINYYRKQEQNAGLPQRLILPTPASIKKECLSVCKARFQKTDLRTLTAFFTMENDQEAMLKAIGRCDRDRFKPLCNFLKATTNATDDLNLELLAWLIDFPYRPFKAEEYSNKSHEVSGILHHTVISEIPEVTNNMYENLPGNGIIDTVDKASRKELAGGRNAISKILKRFTFFNTAQKAAFVTMGILLPTLVGFYFVIDRETASGDFNNSQQKCMIWVGDHYIPSSCEPRRGDTVVVAFDAKRIHSFKRITRPDTITLRSENRIWYIRRGGNIEYYTAGGRHPLDPKRELVPLSKYMILKHIISAR